MIGRLTGVVAALDDVFALVDVQGVGYDVLIPRRVSERLAVGESVVLHTHVAAINDVQQLYGFDSLVDRMVFRKLISVNRLGPKSAATLLSELPGSAIAAAIEAQDSTVLASVSGVGKKTAETVLFALRDDVAKWGIASEAATDGMVEPSQGSIRNQAFMALRQLGFQRQEAENAIADAYEDGLSLNDLTVRALRLVGTNA